MVNRLNRLNFSRVAGLVLLIVGAISLLIVGALSVEDTPSVLTQTSTNFIINEVDTSHRGADYAEFIELYDGAVGNTALDGLVLILYDGDGDISYSAFDLDGQSTGSSGYFVLCVNTTAFPNCDMDAMPDNDLIQNGADAVALYTGDAADFLDGTPVTATNLIDALVYGTGEEVDTGLLVLLNSGQPQVEEGGGGNSDLHSNQRCPDGSGGARNTNAYEQHPPTPGEENTCGSPPAISGTVGDFELALEAEDGNLISVMEVGQDEQASGGAFINATSGTNTKSPEKEASYTFTLPEGGTYFLWAMLYGPNEGSDAIYIGIDGSWDRVYPERTGEYLWNRIESSNISGDYGFALDEGEHEIQVGHAELNARLDSLIVSDDPDFRPE
jgi:hypothetical protein